MRDEILTTPALLSREERIMLYALVTGLRPLRVLEIGTFQGGSARIIAWALEDNGHGHLDCIDPNPRTDLKDVPRATLHVGPSPAGLATAAVPTDTKFDLAYVDGDHSRAAARADVLGVLPHLSPGGYVLVHDAWNQDVAGAINDALAERPELVDCGMVTRHWARGDTDGQSYCGMRLLRYAP